MFSTINKFNLHKINHALVNSQPNIISNPKQKSTSPQLSPNFHTNTPTDKYLFLFEQQSTGATARQSDCLPRKLKSTGLYCNLDQPEQPNSYT
ncbi:MAG: hypothetical protein LBT09_01405 [Planctomycetaceae bacterium]|nr:hypothetical protein [Planctomycetaceae bacterium]